ncbi:MAG TPA: PspA/IM30 family protein [Gammaproteobacteria bacterium]|nr:PspA/IM30 family protein [Gammaproteobacteria bacterium]
MKQSLVERIGQLIRANTHALVNALDDGAPDLLVEQALRNVDATIEEARHALGQVLSKQHHATQQLAQLTSERELLAAQAEQAVRASRDDLAILAIERQIDIEAQLPQLQATIADCLANEAEYNRHIAALQNQRQELQAELARFRQQHGQPLPATSVDELSLALAELRQSSKANQINERLVQLKTSVKDD